MGEKLYYLVEVIIFSFITLILIFAPKLIFKNFKLNLQEKTVNIIRIIAVIATVSNIFINLNKLLQ